MTPDQGARFLELLRTQRPRLARLARSSARGEDQRDLLQEMLLL